MNIYDVSNKIAVMYKETSYSIVQHDEGYYLEEDGKRSWSVVLESSMTDEMNKRTKGKTQFLVTRFISSEGITISYSFIFPSIVNEKDLCSFTIQIDEKKGTFRHVRQECFTEDGKVQSLSARDHTLATGFYAAAEEVLTEDPRYRLAYVTGTFTKI